jgi:hypothetical protein
MSFTMTIGTKRFCAKTIDRIIQNFCRWRDSRAGGSKLDGTHWKVMERGRVCGEITYDGTYCPRNSPERPPWVIVEELLAKKGVSRAMGKSPEFKAGLRAALEWQYMRSPLECPYPQGSPQADAYLAGLEEILGVLDSAGLEKLGGGIRNGEPIKLNGNSIESTRLQSE